MERRVQSLHRRVLSCVLGAHLPRGAICPERCNRTPLQRSYLCSIGVKLDAYAWYTSYNLNWGRARRTQDSTKLITKSISLWRGDIFEPTAADVGKKSLVELERGRACDVLAFGARATRPSILRGDGRAARV